MPFVRQSLTLLKEKNKLQEPFFVAFRHPSMWIVLIFYTHINLPHKRILSLSTNFANMRRHHNVMHFSKGSMWLSVQRKTARSTSFNDRQAERKQKH